MRYMGGKGRIAKDLARVMLAHTTERRAYLEPFVGGAYVLARMAPHFERAYASDVVPDLILFWQAVQRGWRPPDSITLDEYNALRHATPSALRAFAGFGCSFGGIWFRSYGRQAIDARHPNDHVSYGSAVTTARKAPLIVGVEFSTMDYRDHAPTRGAVVYCDPPYVGTTPFPGTPRWDDGAFWKVAESWATSGAHVFVSERQAPRGWVSIWSKVGNTGSLNHHSNTTPNTEHLFTFGAAS